MFLTELECELEEIKDVIFILSPNYDLTDLSSDSKLRGKKGREQM